jgi:hypothetical protein
MGVLASTAMTDAAFVFFTAAVTARRRIAAANWSAFQGNRVKKSCGD